MKNTLKEKINRALAWLYKLQPWDFGMFFVVLTQALLLVFKVAGQLPDLRWGFVFLPAIIVTVVVLCYLLILGIAIHETSKAFKKEMEKK